MTTQDLGTIDQRNPELEGIGRYQFGWSDSDVAGSTAQRGLSEEVVRTVTEKWPRLGLPGSGKAVWK